MEYITLANGVQMPMLGYGVYQVAPEACERCVAQAIDVGYRAIDTAQAYHNEEGVGRAVKASGLLEGITGQTALSELNGKNVTVTLTSRAGRTYEYTVSFSD